MDSSPIPFLKDSSDPKDKGSTMQLVAKKTLQNRLFVGNFQEKRYVASLQAYRDVVVVSNDESELLRDLKAIQTLLVHHLVIVCGQSYRMMFLAITGSK
ncbi:hypothetical protein RN001_006863 [Aquatica leii]|uniref:Uncharacterized protein n=1 Tax=Aquatica leii TaxID=1421715 RepID=A0AAN7SK39_9COLE|nr:hypothetical protein RN001_006863 [Aquatica leii]